MKNSIIFKFIAVLLCALSLLGAIGSAAGILVLTECDLYDNTVDDLYEENVRIFGASRSNAIALRYASANLGGGNNTLTDQILGISEHSVFQEDRFGYILKDAEGNVLEQTELPEKASVYTFTPTGQYLHVVTEMPLSEKYPEETQPVNEPIIVSMDSDLSVVDNVPPEGTLVDRVSFEMLYTGETHEIDYGGYFVGVAYRRPDGGVEFRGSDSFDFDTFTEGAVTRMTMLYQDTVVMEVVSPNGVGAVGLDDYACLKFSSFVYAPVLLDVPAETAPPETIAETVEATEETVPPTEPVVTEPEVAFTYTDNIPKGGCEVLSLKVELMDGSSFSLKDAEGLGNIYVTSMGTVCFRSYTVNERPIDKRCTAVKVVFKDKNGVVFEAACEEGLGDFYYNDNDRLTFISEVLPADASVAAETILEETQETTVSTEPTVPSSASALPATTAPSEVTEETASTEATVPVETTVPAETIVEETAPEETIPAETAPVTVNGRSIHEYEVHRESYYNHQRDEMMYAEYVFLPLPEYTLEMYLAPDALNESYLYTILRIVRAFRNDLFLILGASLLVLAVTVVYLCCAAARRPKSDELRAGGLNRLPLDLYLTIVIFGVMAAIAAGWHGSIHLLQQDTRVGCAFAVGVCFAACLLVVGFVFAFVAQLKTPDGFWWRNTLVGHFMRLTMRFLSWLEQFLTRKGFPFLGRVLKKLWHWTWTAALWCYHTTEKVLLWCGGLTGKLFRRIGSALHRFLSLLPLTWQWLVTGFVILLLMSIIFATNGEEILTVLCLAACVAILVYGSHCFGVLWERTKSMGKGDLDSKVDDKLMLGSFRDFAQDLNELAGVVIVAAQKQLKSERMKTELITNVSHDIKTPLTSIINYVDLLQKPHTEEEQVQYLEVLDRQSQRLKKLIEDLMEMSKASTGNMAVDITQVDAVESVNQALGEFSDKLSRAQLIPVFRHTEPSVAMMADGRLVWRVLSNLLGNAVKYALPGTRLYLDVMALDGKVIISLKNISREELNVDAEELMERFVRGDDSRNTEGSGLGLNIAKSLMELQKGQLQLLVDGDLFKVTLIFPGA